MIIRGISLLFLIGILSLKAEPTLEIDIPSFKFIPPNKLFMLKATGVSNMVYAVEFSTGAYDRGKLEWIHLANIETDDLGVWVSPLTRLLGPQAFFRLRQVRKASGIQN